MANYWYVSSVSGIADINTLRTTTDITVQRTGAFTAMAAADHYPTIAAAFLGDATGLPVAGDFIFVANDHSFSSTAQITLGSAAVCNTPVIVMSVLETACDQYTAGASEAVTGGSNDIRLAGHGAKATCIGVDFSTDDNIQVIGSQDGIHLAMKDCTVTFTSSGDQLHLASASDGAYVEFDNVDFVWTLGTTVEAMRLGTACKVLLNNCTFDDGTTSIDDLLGISGANGGYAITIKNTDLSQIGGYIQGGEGADPTADDNIYIRLENCKMNADPPLFVEEPYQSAGQYFLATNCSSDAGKAEYQFYQKTMAGVVQDSGDDSTSPAKYREESLAFANGNKISFKWTTDSDCSEGFPLSCGLMNAKVVDLTSTATLTFYITQVDTNVNLTTANTWFEVSYPLAADNALWDTKSSRATDILSATELTADGGDSDWRDHTGSALTGHDEYKISVTAVGGALCVPDITMHTTVANTTFNVAVRFGTS